MAVIARIEAMIPVEVPASLDSRYRY